jgi:hypothetical protein
MSNRASTAAHRPLSGRAFLPSCLGASRPRARAVQSCARSTQLTARCGRRAWSGCLARCRVRRRSRCCCTCATSLAEQRQHSSPQARRPQPYYPRHLTTHCPRHASCATNPTLHPPLTPPHRALAAGVVPVLIKCIAEGDALPTGGLQTAFGSVTALLDAAKACDLVVYHPCPLALAAGSVYALLDAA